MDTISLAVAYGAGSLGAAGALFFIISYIVFEDLRTKSRQLLLYLSIADLAQAVRFLTLQLDFLSPAVCSFQSLFGIWVASSSFFWTASISVYVYLVVKNPNRLFPAWGYRLFHVLCWGYPTVFALVVLTVDPAVTSGSDVPWCFLDPRSPVGWRIAGYAGPLVVCWSVTATMYLLASWHIQQNSANRILTHAADRNSPQEMEMRELQTKFKLIPLVFLLLRVWDLSYHAFTFYTQTVEPLGRWLLWLMIFGDSSQGFFNCLIFVCLTRKIRGRMLTGMGWGRTGGERERLFRKSQYYGENL